MQHHSSTLMNRRWITTQAQSAPAAEMKRVPATLWASELLSPSQTMVRDACAGVQFSHSLCADTKR
jgi:hypothetical protein